MRWRELLQTGGAPVVVAAVILQGCSGLRVGPLQPSTPVATAAVPAAGTKLDAQAIRALMPTYKVGMKWVYRIGGSFPKPPSPVSLDEMSEEVMAVSSSSITMKMTMGGRPAVIQLPLGDSPMDRTGPGGIPLPGPESMDIVSEGPEDVTVPAGVYKGATKVTARSKSTTMTTWYASGVGPVKSVTTISIGGKDETMTQELVSFGDGSSIQGAASGKTLDASVFSAFAPPARKGVKQRYMMTASGGEPSAQYELLLESTAVCGERVMYRESPTSPTGGGLSYFTIGAGDLALLDRRRLVGPEMALQDAGQEDVVVSAGTFRGARKIRAVMAGGFMSNYEATLWLAPGAGVVKATAKGGGMTEFGQVESSMTLELKELEVPAGPTVEDVPAPLFEHGGRLSLDGLTVPTASWWRVEVGSEETDVVWVRNKYIEGGSPAGTYRVELEIGGAVKTKDGFTLAPEKAQIRSFQIARDEGRSKPVTWWDSARGARLKSFQLTGVEGKLTGVFEAEGGATQTGPMSTFKFEFDIFDREFGRSGAMQ